MEREPIIDQCLGCEHIGTGVERGPSHCLVYLNPSIKWRIGRCIMATHIKREPLKVTKINPIKASKRNIKM